VVTVTSTTPLPAGAIAVIAVGESAVICGELFAPKRTLVAPARLAPLIVTAMPPACGPEAGLTAATLGTSRLCGFHCRGEL
jgi:hypothetical protein